MRSIQTNKINPSVTEQIKTLISLFDNEFLKPEIIGPVKYSYITYEETGESRVAPTEHMMMDAGERVIEEGIGHLCRLSAPGYLDATDWTLCKFENEILEWIEREAEALTEGL